MNMFSIRHVYFFLLFCVTRTKYVFPFMSKISPNHLGRESFDTINKRSGSSRLFYSEDEDQDVSSRTSEFSYLEPLKETELRKTRQMRSQQVQEQFCAYGDELWDLRKNIHSLSKKLVGALSERASSKVQGIRALLNSAERRDPELSYELSLNAMILAEDEGKIEEAAMYREEAENARSCLPHLNLEGLWIGKYGSQGYQMINVTYVGDTLIAYKVTGDDNVPRGEISFKADLTPTKTQKLTESLNEELPPIELSNKAAKKWGTKKLSRYAGSGQVAESGFKNTQWMDGQLIVIGDNYFSFAWLPISFQIFFGRPSPELALKMMRESGHILRTTGTKPPALDDDLSMLKEYAMRCLDVTELAREEEGQHNEFGCIWDSEDSEECYFE